jgi:hypothetical protein
MPLKQGEKLTTYSRCFELLGIPYDDKAKRVISMLEKEGHTEKSIGFAVYKTEEKLLIYRGDKQFWNVFVNEVRKWSWPKDDPRWIEYSKRKDRWTEIKRKELEWQERKKKRDLIEKISDDRGKYPGFVYFIQGESGGPIKIGYAKDVSRRIAEIQTGFPDNLICLTFFPGNIPMEQLIHKDLKQYWLRGEWYKPDPFVLKKMKAYEKRANELAQKPGFNHKTCV